MKKRLRTKQYNALSHARSYAVGRKYDMFVIWVQRAAQIRCITDLQWFNLQVVAGEERVKALRKEMEAESAD